MKTRRGICSGSRNGEWLCLSDVMAIGQFRRLLGQQRKLSSRIPAAGPGGRAERKLQKTPQVECLERRATQSRVRRGTPGPRAEHHDGPLHRPADCRLSFAAAGGALMGGARDSA